MDTAFGKRPNPKNTKCKNTRLKHTSNINKKTTASYFKKPLSSNRWDEITYGGAGAKLELEIGYTSVAPKYIDISIGWGSKISCLYK
jgi:hypothetical protein